MLFGGSLMSFGKRTHGADKLRDELQVQWFAIRSANHIASSVLIRINSNYAKDSDQLIRLALWGSNRIKNRINGRPRETITLRHIHSMNPTDRSMGFVEGTLP